MQRLTGSRIVLRDYVLADSVGIHKWRSDVRTTMWMGPKFRVPVTLQEQRNSLARIIGQPSEEALYLAIADKQTSRYIGGIDLTGIDWIDRRAVLSIVISDEADRGKGYGSEAIQLLLRHAFQEMRLHRIELNVSAANERALACYKRNGFQVEGRKREHSFVNEEYSDDIQMGILEQEYRSGV